MRRPPTAQCDYPQAPLLVPPNNYPMSTYEDHSMALNRQPTGGRGFKRFDHDKFDFSNLSTMENIKDFKTERGYIMDVLLNTWVLFNAVTTLMVIVTSFKRNVDPYRVQEFGEFKFDVIVKFLTYLPLLFLVVVVLMFNNSYSERVYYMYLAKNGIIDYPASNAPMSILKQWRSYLFFLPWIIYFAFGLIVMLKFNAAGGTIFSFLNNLVVGIMLFWYRQQAIESKLISLSDFIQSFQDSQGVYGNIDEVSLKRAANFLESITLCDSREPSFSDYMRLFFWREKSYSSVSMCCHHFFVWVIIGSLSGAAVAYFLTMQHFEVQGIYDRQITPCVSSTQSAFASMNAANSTAQQCGFAVCTCLRNLGLLADAAILEQCTSAITKNTLCVGHCPTSCSVWAP